ncbi:MAG: hypothetical protein N3D73_01355 [Candidatus Diapherotrites archaeon]|nr:hypothetical protein [Candidatus Diapherotrites archaeon]
MLNKKATYAGLVSLAVILLIISFSNYYATYYNTKLEANYDLAYEKLQIVPLIQTNAQIIYNEAGCNIDNSNISLNKLFEVYDLNCTQKNTTFSCKFNKAPISFEIKLVCVR